MVNFYKDFSVNDIKIMYVIKVIIKDLVMIMWSPVFIPHTTITECN